jgi:multiple sugar transport system permease protein
MRRTITSWRLGGLRWEEYRAAIILLLPALVGIVVFSFIPIVQALSTSFYDAPLISRQRTFIGLDNYVTAFHDPVFIRALVNTLLYAAGTLILQVTVALGLALMIRDRLPGLAFFRSAYFLPVITSLVVVSTVWKVMYNTNNGLINSLLQTFGLPGQPWLTSPYLALPSLIILGTWKEVGFSMLVLLGGLNNIPSELYEAASIDGARGWNRFWKVTLPLLRRPMLFVVVLSTINAFKVFTPVYLMTLGGPLDSTQTAVYYVFQTSFQYFKLGYGSALSFLVLALVLVFTVAQFRLLRTDVEY